VTGPRRGSQRPAVYRPQRSRACGVSGQPAQFSPKTGVPQAHRGCLEGCEGTVWPGLTSAVLAPMRSGPVKGRGGSALPGGLWVGFSCRRWMPGRSPGARWSARWTNDLAAGQDRRRIMGREGPDSIRRWLACTHSGPGCGVRMTVSPDPGCSVRSTAVLQAHAKTRARPVVAFSGVFCWASSWVRMWKERASSRRAMATVAMLLPRRWASWP
jgi:hypothetical protein